jgi:predicted O-methyltransferase YrrM
MVKKILKDMLSSAFDKIVLTPRGKSFLINMLQNHPQLCIEAFGRRTNLSQRFENISDWPDKVSSFEDLYFLFSCTQLNMGIAALAFDEAAYLYKVIKNLKSANIVEIGRFKGGGTFLMAAAMDNNSRLRSYDIHVKMTEFFDGQKMDQILQDSLNRYGLADKVEIIVGNSCEVNVGEEALDLIFIDGDHSYEGVKKDFLHWHKKIKPGGNVLIHDSAKPREFTTYHEEVARFVYEVERDFAGHFRKIKEIGSIIHFSRTENNF